MLMATFNCLSKDTTLYKKNKEEQIRYWKPALQVL
jgi:hypothetical protein